MANVNKCHLLGNVTREIELRYTPKGTAVAEIGLAINRKRRHPETNEPIEDTTYVDVTLWGRLAEIAVKYLAKGRPVYIEGRLHLDTWEDKETGKSRQRLKVIAENLQLLPSGDRPNAKSSAPAQNQPTPGDHIGNDDAPEDDLPF